MPFHQIVERDGQTGRIQRTFVYDTDGIHARIPDSHGKVQKKFIYSHDSHEISELTGEKDDRIRRVLSFSEGTAILSEGGGYRKIRRLYQISEDGTEIKEREGSRFGPVVRTFIFGPKGVLEKEGEEYSEKRMFVFEQGSPFIREKSGGWYGTVSRVFECERIDPWIFMKPEAFLQFIFVVD
ncbi:MAG: hypothetical protein QHG99_07315 [Methanomicrobiales archaeon]|nr:hypothetical protein [Methanomicrobiales archaeon]